MILILTALAHYNGGARMREPGDASCKVHLPVLLALMAAVETVDYFLGRFRVNFWNAGSGERSKRRDPT